MKSHGNKTVGVAIDLDKVVSDVGYSSLRVVMSVIRGIILVPIITKLLGPDVYGTWAAAFAIFGLMTGIGSLHLHGSLIRYLPADEDGDQTFIDLLALSVLAATLISLSFATIIGPFLFDSIGRSTRGITLSVAVAFALFPYLPLKIIENYPRAQGDVKTYEIIRLSRLTIETVVLVTVFLILGSPVIAFVMMAGVAFLLGTVLLLVFSIQITLPRLTNARQYLAYGLPMLPKQVGEKTVQSIDRYLVVALLSATAGGIYAAVYLIPSFIHKFTSIMNPTLYPTIIEAWEKEEIESIESTYGDIFRWYTILVVPSAVGLSLLAEPLLLLLSTAEIANRAWHLVPIIAVGIVIYGYGDLAVYVLNAAEDTTRIATANVIGALSNLIFNLALIPVIGIEGAAIATVCSFTIIALIILLSVRKYVFLSFDFYLVIKVGVASLIMFSVLVLIPISGNLTKILFYPVIGILVYFGFLVSSGTLSTDEFNNIDLFLWK